MTALLKLIRGQGTGSTWQKLYRLLPDVPVPGLRYVFRVLSKGWPHAMTLELHDGGKHEADSAGPVSKQD